MVTVPGVEREQLVERHQPAVLGMTQLAGAVGWAEPSEERHPAGMQCLEQRERDAHRKGPASGSSAQRASSYGLIVGVSSVSASRKRV